MHSIQLLPDRECLSFTEVLDIHDTHYDIINCTIILKRSDLNVLSESSDYLILLKTKEWLVIITNVVRTLVLTTQREGLVSQNPRRPDPSQSKENNNRLGVLSFTVSFQGGIHRYDFPYMFFLEILFIGQQANLLQIRILAIKILNHLKKESRG
jgi:hypothetical protein